VYDLESTLFDQRSDGTAHGRPTHAVHIGQVLTVAQVFDLAGRMPARFRAMVLLAAFASLRWGEVSVLRRCDIAEDGSWVRITRAFVELTEKGLIVGPPKSKAGARTLTLPTAVRADILRHLETYTQGSRDALVFTGENGGLVRRPNFNQRVKWTATVKEMGLTGLHFHDLRHAGQHVGSTGGHVHPGPYDADGPRRYAGRAHLPACDQRSRPGHRRSTVRNGPTTSHAAVEHTGLDPTEHAFEGLG
jgi:integrase